MAPAYVTLAPGLDWHPAPNFSIFFSPIGGRLVLVTNEPKSYYFQGGVIPNGDGGGYEMPMSTYYGVDPARGKNRIWRVCFYQLQAGHFQKCEV